MATLLEGARMTLAEKLAWLEETARAVDHLHRRATERLRNAVPLRSSSTPAR